MMKEVGYTKHHDQKGFLFIFDVPETEDCKGTENVAVTIHIPPYNEYGKIPDTQYMEVVAKLLAEADWYSIAKEEYYGKDYEGNEIAIPDEDWEYSIRYGAKRTTFIEKLDKIDPPFYDKKDLDHFISELPSHLKYGTRSIIQVLNEIKRTYHPKNGYKGTNVIEECQGMNLYQIAVSRFNEYGEYVTGSKPYMTTGKNDYRRPNYWYAVRDLLSVGKVSKHEASGRLFVETEEGFKTNLCFVDRGTIRFSIFEDEQFFNSFMMDYETTVVGKFLITTGSSIDDTKKLIELDGKYRIYQYKQNLFAFVKQQ